MINKPEWSFAEEGIPYAEAKPYLEDYNAKLKKSVKIMNKMIQNVPFEVWSEKDIKKFM